jgi:4-amino-4-deoxy-L-arabinose transferase-like glycosyltransferase
MLDSGDWVTARLDGIAYLEKSPLKYWMIAICFKVFGVHDWSARLPVAFSAIALCLLTLRFGAWAFSVRAGLYAGLILATCVGLFLFTRWQIPDATVTATIALAMWGFLRALDENEPRPGLWAGIMAAAIGAGLLLKGLIAAVFPVAAALIFLACTGELFSRVAWRRLRFGWGLVIALAIAAPWHILATLRNPPYFDLTMHSGPGEYRGFFWFYFMNEHVLRFLNLRYPRDYNTVPRLYFWLLHFVWLFPWSVYLPDLVKLSYGRSGREDRARLLCLCWTGFLLVFFTFSSTQEYYSMPCYPALALLIASALWGQPLKAAAGLLPGASAPSLSPNAPPNHGGSLERLTPPNLRFGQITLIAVVSAAALVILGVLLYVRNLPAPGDISRALQQHQESYTLSLGHMGDLTLAACAYLKLPLAIAGAACLIGALSIWRAPIMGAVAMMIVFVHAARTAEVTFEPYLSSRPLAVALNHAPVGTLILDDQYYTFSSIVFYAEAYHGQRVLLLNGRVNNLEYGSYAPDAPQDIFIDDPGFRARWLSPALYYICVDQTQVARLRGLVGAEAFHTLIESGGKFVFSNRPV